MIIFGTCAGGGRYETVAGPSIRGVALPDDLVLTASGEAGICRAYNSFVESARSEPDCEALVLLHDDVKIVDPNFRAKLVAAVKREGVGVVGVVGGSGLRGLAWWDARDTAGAVFETRGYIEMGPRRADVAAVDGLLMVLAPAAFNQFTFDEATFPRFHGYDADYCLQVKDLGLRVVVAPLDVLHRTKTGYGDETAFEAADRELVAKWPEYIRPEANAERLVSKARAVVKKGLRVSRRVRARLADLRSTLSNGGVPTQLGKSSDTATGIAMVGGAGSPECPVCGIALAIPLESMLIGTAMARCDACETAVTWPPSPSRSEQEEARWAERYGDRWLESRDVWHREAKLRLEWLQLHRSEGCLLEVGCATGEFVKAAADAGFDAYGVEASAWAAAHARSIGADAVTGHLGDWQREYHGVRPDVVAMWHALEHAPDPVVLLAETAQLLGPGGLLVLEGPNYVAPEVPGGWHDRARPELNEHSPRLGPDGLRSLLTSAGFLIDEMLLATRRVYTPLSVWRAEKNAALLAGHSWPPVDLVRVRARVAGPSSR